MIYSVDEIKNDVKDLSEKDFYTKYIVRSDNWYLEKYLGRTKEQVVELLDSYRLIISEALGVSFNSVMMVGSGKLGVSLSVEKSNGKSKLFMAFDEDGNTREGNKSSDIDIAIISSEIFHYFWKLFRQAYSYRQWDTYLELQKGIYRGYINEEEISSVQKCRNEWDKKVRIANAALHDQLYFQQEVSYRIYRSWEDFEEYNLESIKKIKERVTNDEI